MIKTILFDLDGTLLDTHQVIFESFKRTFNALAPHLDTDNMDYHAFIGPPIDVMFAKYLDNDQIGAAIDYFRTTNINLHKEYVSIYPYIEEVLKNLKANNYDIGIVSSKVKSSITYGLKLFNLYDYFDFIVGYDDVSQPKPDPQGIFMAMNYFNSSPNTTLMIGDALSDIKAAKNAGCKSAMVTYSLLDKKLITDAQADVYFDDMRELLTYLGGF